MLPCMAFGGGAHSLWSWSDTDHGVPRNFLCERATKWEEDQLKVYGWTLHVTIWLAMSSAADEPLGWPRNPHIWHILGHLAGTAIFATDHFWEAQISGRRGCWGKTTYHAGRGYHICQIYTNIVFRWMAWGKYGPIRDEKFGGGCAA